MENFEDSLDGMLRKACDVLEDGINNIDSYFHTPTLCTINGDNISSRTVVLRGFIEKERTLRFHTDARSAKTSQITQNRISCVHAYDKQQKIQIRLDGHTEIHQNDGVTEHAWENAKSMSKLCYTVAGAPGMEISAPEAYDADQAPADVEAGYDNFCVVLFTFNRLEMLYLKHTGHRRSSFEWSEQGLAKRWLIP